MNCILKIPLSTGRPRLAAGCRWGLTLLLAAPLLATSAGPKKAALPPPPEMETVPGSKPAPAVASLPRGSTPGNAANSNEFGFEGEWIYYAHWRTFDDPKAPPPGLYRCKAADGSARSLVGPAGATERIYADISVHDGWVYYCAMQGFYRIRTDGSKLKRLTEDEVQGINVVGDWVYCQKKHDRTRIWRMKLDGGSAKRLSEDEAGAYAVSSEGFIYYVNKADKDCLYRMKFDGTERKKIGLLPTYEVVAEGGVVWFTDKGRYFLHRMKADGSAPEVVVEDRVGYVNPAGGFVYFVRDGSINRCKPDGSEMESVSAKAERWNFCLYRDQLFFRLLEQRVIQRQSLAGGEAAPLLR